MGKWIKGEKNRQNDIKNDKGYRHLKDCYIVINNFVYIFKNLGKYSNS